jgi:hypothetical protein
LLVFDSYKLLKFKSGKIQVRSYAIKNPGRRRRNRARFKRLVRRFAVYDFFNAQGEPVYSKQGKFKTDVLVAKIEKF